MMLREELTLLAERADRYPDPDAVLRLAGRRRTRTLLAASGAVLAVLAVAVAAAAWAPGRPHRPAAAGPVTVQFTPDWAGQVPDQRVLDAVAALLTRRVAALGLAGATVRAGTGTPGVIVLTVPGGTPDGTLAGLAAPGQLRIRLALASHREPAGAPTAPAPNGTGPAPTLAQVQAKLGPAYPLALSFQDPDQVGPADAARLAPFGGLSTAEVAALPVPVQYAVPAVRCAQLDPVPVAARPADHPVTACGADQDPVKYLLDAAAVTNVDVAAAVASDSPANGGWGVQLVLTPAGQARFTGLTGFAAGHPYPTGEPRQVAIEVDGSVLVAPSAAEAITGDVLLAGPMFTAAGAPLLAALLGAGPLPVRLRITRIDR